MAHPDSTLASFEVHAQRRRRVLERLGHDAAMVIAASPEIVVGRDTELRYHVDAELFYLTGYTEPEAVVVLNPSQDRPFTLFVRPRDDARELWTGFRGGLEAGAVFGADQTFAIAELATRLPQLIGNVSVVYARTDPMRPVFSAALEKAMAAGLRARPRTGRGPHTRTDPGVVLDGMRVIKDAHEIERMRHAARVTAEAFAASAATIRPGAGEWQVEARLEAAFRSAGAHGTAFPSIIAGGANATTLHYITNDRPITDGSMVLIDAGARVDMYCADISRTFPADGRFTPVQRAIYDVVHAAHQAGIAAVRPGATIDDVHDAAVGQLTQGLIDLGLARGPVERLLENPAELKRYYPHRTSHWLGLEVHDVGAYAGPDGPRRLEPGMVLTVEPGLYIPAGADAPEELRGTGVRIEDDVLVTDAGHEVLTASLPSDAEAVQALVVEP